MRKLIIFTSSVVALIVACILVYRLFDKKEKSSEIVLYGNVDVRQVDIGFRVAGRVVELYFEEGDFVPEGSLMAVLDQSPYDSQVTQAEANLAAVEANLENANLLLDRRTAAAGFGGVSQQELDNALSSRDELFSQHEAARAALQVAIDNMEYTQVYAPTDGIILSRVREPGTAVNPTDSVYVLSVCSPIWIRAYVNEPQLGLIYYGMLAEVHTDSGNKYSGKIGFISPVAEFTPKTVETTQLRSDLVYRLRIYIDRPDRFLKQGMPVTVQLDCSSPVQEPEHAKKNE